MGVKGPISSGRTQRQRRQPKPIALNGSGRKAPTLPDASKLPAQVTRWWRVLWASPLAGEFRDVDEPGLVRMALLWAKALSGSVSAAELSELRQLEDRFGCNPTARRRLGWRLDEPDEDQPAPVSDPELLARVTALQGRI